MIGESVTAVEALTVTVFSMTLVFLTLFAISLMLDVFGMSHKKDKIKKNKEQEQKQVETKVVENTSNQSDDEELVSVITAALMQSLNTSADNLIIRRIRQIQDPTWAQTGRIENMN